MPADERWAAAAAALPTSERAERELPFWRALAASFGWRRVADAGCGSGFHVALLRGLGIEAVGFDAALSVVRSVPGTLAGDVAHPPLRPGTFDAALFVGNTVSLLASRAEQMGALAALAALVRTGGTLLIQGEDVGALVARGPVVRSRPLEDGTTHVRVFERSGRRVRMLAGVVRPGGQSPLESTLLLPTSAGSVLRLARPLGLKPAALPCAPPGAGPTWWAALSAPSP